MKNIFATLLLVSLLLASCGQKDKGGNLSEMKSKLEKLETNRDNLEKEIEKLQNEIAKIDTTNKTLNIKSIAVDTVTDGSFTSQVEMMGKIDVDANSTISASTGGTVTHIYVTEGNFVKTGQTLARVDDAVMQQNIAQVKQQLSFATEIFEKQKKLWDQKIGSEVQYLSAKNNKESLEANLRTLYQTNELYKIKAPFSGVVDLVSLKLGQTIAPGMPAFRIVSNAGITLKAEIPESYATKIKKGASVDIFFPDLKKSIPGVVKYISAVINPLNRTYSADIILKGSTNEVKTDMVGIIKLKDYYKAKTIAIPIKTLLKNTEGYYVYTAKSDNGNLIATATPIKIGVVNGAKVEVLSGLKNGDLLITSGTQNINSGDYLKIN